MVFTIYADSNGTTSLWTETQSLVAVEKGVFNVFLGSVDSIPPSVFDGNTRYLGVKVGDDPEMRPLKAMVSVAYAYKSFKADTADYALSAPANPDNDWVLIGNVLHPVSDYGLSMRQSNVLHGVHDSTHVNLGIASSTGDSIGVSGDFKYCTVGGGMGNTASGEGATVSGGINNQAIGEGAFVGGGSYNAASPVSTVGGGHSNVASGVHATIGGGLVNSAGGWYSTVPGGYGNHASGDYAIAGGDCNTASALCATVSGGISNFASGYYTIVGGGRANTASWWCATVGGGQFNTASEHCATVGGGNSNTASSSGATVGGGNGNTASSSGATVSGGWNNQATGYQATIGGGYANTVAGDYSFATGDSVWLTADADYSFAFGHNFTTSATHASIFYDASSEMKVGIQTTSPTARLDVGSSTGYNQIRMRTPYTPTGSDDANGNEGDIAWDENYFYVKTSAGWKRVAMSAW
jgi:hypothetical protein